MTHKKRVSLFIDGELADRARAYGLNLSRFMGNGLSVYFSSIERGYSWKWENSVCRGWDLNPRIPTEPDPQSGAFDQSRQPLQVYADDFNSYLSFFLPWIFRQFSTAPFGQNAKASYIGPGFFEVD